MDESKALSDAHEAWRQANIQVILSEMQRYGLTIADLLANDIDPGDNKPMVSTTQTPILPAPGYKVAGE